MKKTQRVISIKDFLNFGILACAMLFDLALDYIQAGFDASLLKDPAFWIQLVLTNMAIVVSMISYRNIVRDKTISKDEEIQKLIACINISHSNINLYRLSDTLDKYIEEDNLARKLKAYENHLKREIDRIDAIIAKAKFKFTINRLNNKRNIIIEKLKKAPEQIDHINYNKYAMVRKGTLYSTSILKYGDDEGLEDEDGKYLMKMIVNKLVFVLAFGVLGSCFTYSLSQGISWTLIVSTVTKTFKYLWALRTSGSEGENYVLGVFSKKLKTRTDYLQVFADKNRGIIDKVKAEIEIQKQKIYNAQRFGDEQKTDIN